MDGLGRVLEGPERAGVRAAYVPVAANTRVDAGSQTGFAADLEHSPQRRREQHILEVQEQDTL